MLTGTSISDTSPIPPPANKFQFQRNVLKADRKPAKYVLHSPGTKYYMEGGMGMYARHIPLRRPKQVRFCTGMSANLVQVICPIYLLFLTTKFDYSLFWPNYPQKCMIFLQKSSHNFCHFTQFSVKCTIFWGFSDYKTLLFVVVLSLLFFAHLKIQVLRRRFPKSCKSTTFSYSYCEASQYGT